MLIKTETIESLNKYYGNIKEQTNEKINALTEFKVRHSSDDYEIEGNSITGGDLIRIPASRYSHSTQS